MAVHEVHVGKMKRVTCPDCRVTFIGYMPDRLLADHKRYRMCRPCA